MTTPPNTTNHAGSAYELLSKPTSEITDADLEVIVADFRKRREFYLAGKADNPAKKPRSAAATTAAEKAANTAAILAQLDLKI